MIATERFIEVGKKQPVGCFFALWRVPLASAFFLFVDSAEISDNYSRKLLFEGRERIWNRRN